MVTFLRASALMFTLGAALVACSDPAPALFTQDASLPGDLPDAADGPSSCTSDPMCDDHISCTIDHCRANACTHEACTDCCATGLQCVVGVGCDRAPRPCTMDSECADAIRCTLDRCRDGRYCEHSAQEGLCDSGQICLAAVGCVPRPPDTCRTDSDCNTNPCFGSWFCSNELGCQFRAVMSCDDSDACTTDTCDTTRGCLHAPRDADGDGHASMACHGDDCDDMNPARYPGATEICGNGVDENCNGIADDACCAVGQACTTTCGSTGTTTCTAGGMMGPCAPPAETCNGRDDNCNGMTDEGCCSSGMSCTTSCGSTGTVSCAAGMAGTCIPPAETCNGRDDNCNGVTDEGCCAAGGACMTACGTTGTATCNAMGMAGPCRAPAETCNGRDDDCDGAVDNTFACARGAVSACTTACGSMGTRTCNTDCTMGPCVAPMERCNGRDDDCDGVTDNGFACVAGATGTCGTTCGSMGRRTCTAACGWDVCVPPAEVCNGFDDNCNATCDEGFACCARSTRDCSALGFVSGTAVCRGDCGGYDTTTCSNCGNRRREGTEQCDGTDLGTATCASQGFGGGTLRCSSTCSFDASGCLSCGNGRADTGETCDGTDLRGATCASIGMGFSGGTLRCSATCTAFDATMCTRPFNPTGTWVVSPGVNLYCGFGAVMLSFGMLTFTDTGTALTVSGGRLNCAMTGPSARTTRAINVTCSQTGGCDEFYTLTGTFGTDNAFTGTFTARFAGSGCFDCATRTFPVTGSR